MHTRRWRRENVCESVHTRMFMNESISFNIHCFGHVVQSAASCGVHRRWLGKVLRRSEAGNNRHLPPHLHITFPRHSNLNFAFTTSEKNNEPPFNRCVTNTHSHTRLTHTRTHMHPSNFAKEWFWRHQTSGIRRSTNPIQKPKGTGRTLQVGQETVCGVVIGIESA